MFVKLAVGNIRKNAATYVPYILTCVLTVAMFYIMRSLAKNPGVEGMVGGSDVAYCLDLGCRVVAVFAFIFLFYTHSFLIRRRKKEFGIFHILGLEKRHIARVFGWETLLVTALGLAAGLGLGIALDKAAFLLIGRIMGGPTQLGFFLSFEVVCYTLAFFCLLFFLIYLNTVRQIYFSQSIELLRAGNAGEREPKTRWIMTLVGVICLGAGYYQAIMIQNPIVAMLMFFVAVLLVIAGTYLLFTAGSIALLKGLRGRKSFYYRTRNFISVSGMIYRMKQNAVGLANICILSTMVLVMVSTTSSMMLGLESALRRTYPMDICISSGAASPAGREDIAEAAREAQREAGVHVTEEILYTTIELSLQREGNRFYYGEMEITNIDSVETLFFVSLEDYNRAAGEERTLAEDELLIYSTRKVFGEPTLQFFDQTYTVAGQLKDFPDDVVLSTEDIVNSHYVVVPDLVEISRICERQPVEELQQIAWYFRNYYGFNLQEDSEEQIAFVDTLHEKMNEREYSVWIQSRAASRSNYVGLYGGLFTIGIFLGSLFLMATVLIIYYKQISEGYDDRERFRIMQNVGMSREEVRRTIHSQILLVFFLPLVVAGVHVTAAFPMISKMLALLNLRDVKLYMFCSLGCFLAFAVLYVLIYMWTARTYYKIVRQ